MPASKYSRVPVNTSILNGYGNFTDLEQPEHGFGFSNFRIEPTLPDSINRQTSAQYHKVTQPNQPQAVQAYKRHSNFFFREQYPDHSSMKRMTGPNVPDNHVYWNIIKNFEERNPLQERFFSKRNLDHLQQMVIKLVYQQSNGAYQISRQSDQELLVIMRSIYLQSPKNPLAKGVQMSQEIARLNQYVLDQVVPKVLVGVQSYLGYVRDQSQTNYPPIHPQYMDETGTKVTRGFSSVFI